jgi:hypothetical protein
MQFVFMDTVLLHIGHYTNSPVRYVPSSTTVSRFSVFPLVQSHFAIDIFYARQHYTKPNSEKQFLTSLILYSSFYYSILNFNKNSMSFELWSELDKLQYLYTCSPRPEDGDMSGRNMLTSGDYHAENLRP